MKLASLKGYGRDGMLVLVNRALTHYLPLPGIAPTLQQALEDWDELEPEMRFLEEALNFGACYNPARFDPTACHSPLPRAYQWADGSAYVNHVELVRRARGAELPPEFWTDPLIYQGGSDSFVGPHDPILAADENWGIDFEGEVAVITGDLRMGATEAEAAKAIRLLLLVNDVSLRNLIPGELAKGFGFFQSKPASAFSPVAITPDELGADWRDGRVHRPLTVHLNNALFGHPDAGTDMVFSFPQLVAHAAKTRELEAGSIIGGGTVSNRQNGLHGSSIANGGVGYCCLAELRTYEAIETGKPQTPFLRFGDTVKIEMFGRDGNSLFGAIEQRVEKYPG
ncbi:MAG TPA: fumarylacetoacetate hydrolase family protein [Accumulibacter sp.]|uniref:fumarylacetoacetate hydrolase family protein n=1 Tax=Accumulibacter sp. TaxID=2053492 RepID=UPI002879ADC6|nr:fumarylacetoacetate hydrolase family protein [Accumulibacter sp.]MDS4014236.1 fumarylacetoacetate hydrolase family protein [Accumulibacter sp.]HMV04631.1 fumarylacetoacetate hydrolase family protein [Accumulibacter sp.]HMW81626.1 fumarylacetoacetate hydrolase family protein [Accumulibacter sp.]HMX69706.1 fumarylacetoacetate hydrolase family protein [Accumulibacter sp.]HNB67104.1 fumarylacetoacetate hydrolase family protein [Accumulibacter sp.]